MGIHCFSAELYSLLSPTGLHLKHKKKIWWVHAVQNTERNNKLSRAEYLEKVSPAIIVYACIACIHSPPSSIPVFFLNDCSCLFRCLRFYCLKLEQMVISLLNTKLCHAGIIIAAELAPCKSGFILWNRLKDSEEIHCAAGCLWWAEWMTLHSWPKIQCWGDN